MGEDRRDCCWLYVVTNCAAPPTLQEPIKDPRPVPLARSDQGGFITGWK
ncbi:MAG: hypothetical protein Q8O04_05940 [Deltaproteobacteria bacterium]|nr:hypothetical protein [Deltaproteobacteria bacterium]